MTTSMRRQTAKAQPAIPVSTAGSVLDSLSVRNFRGVIQGTIGGFRALNVLAGRNGCGKSTVLDAAYLALSGDSGALSAVGYRRTLRGDLATTYLVPFGRSATIEIAATLGDVDVGFSAEWGGGGGTSRHIAPKEWKAPRVRFVGVRRDEKDLEEAFAAVADLGAEAVERLEQLVRAAHPGVRRILTRMQADNTRPYLSLVVNEGSYPIHVAGDGLQRLFLVACHAATLKGGVLLIEEPEAHQHPAYLTLLARVLAEAARSGTQVIFTTHSLELIDRILEATAEVGEEALSQTAVHLITLEGGRLAGRLMGADDAAKAREAVQLELR